MLITALLSIFLVSQPESIMNDEIELIMNDDPIVASTACGNLMQGSPKPLELIDLLSMDYLPFSGECNKDVHSGRVFLQEDADLANPENQVFLLHSPPSIADIAVCLIVNSSEILSLRFPKRETCSIFVNEGSRNDFFNEFALAIAEHRDDYDLVKLFDTYDVRFISLEHNNRTHPLVPEQMNPGEFYCHLGEACTHYAVKVKESAEEAEKKCQKNNHSRGLEKDKRRVE